MARCPATGPVRQSPPTAAEDRRMQPNDSACIFCKIVAAQIPSFKLYEDDDSISFLDINPANEGHALAVAKGHWPTLHDIPEPALTRVTAAAKKVAAAVQKVLSPSGIN